MAAGGRGIVLSLRSGSDGLVVLCDCFVRFVLHLLVCSSWCSSVPVAGLLLVDWVVPVRPPTTEPGECMDRSGGSTDKWHAYSSALLMGFEDLFVVSGSGREFHPGFFFITGDGEGSACGSEVGGGEDRWCSFKRVEGPWAGAVLLAAAVAEDNMSPSHPLPIRMQWRSSWWRHSYSHQLHQYGAYMVFNEMPKL
ncbi:hypothetical protein PAHAL_2G233400 [Panicum hallii]|uniref:Uncharacterized protein n=1 Tax=Panicum hallii TaxID=206008 RepID=A0A2S3GYW8_9POAL|nr:hypothetical protein PAHAL_2G233400 [Panicum hallii]PAN11986.1 hypothetical protein PAHAL_2G233400 [Panicum hallii]PAN11987.1 hypothetical protein PAHAL_2G233400 [Panicum hallii]